MAKFTLLLALTCGLSAPPDPVREIAPPVASWQECQELVWTPSIRESWLGPDPVIRPVVEGCEYELVCRPAAW